MDFEKHEATVMREAIGRESGCSERYAAEGFDWVRVELKGKIV